jgi:hypothetical protein
MKPRNKSSSLINEFIKINFSESIFVAHEDLYQCDFYSLQGVKYFKFSDPNNVSFVRTEQSSFIPNSI